MTSWFNKLLGREKKREDIYDVPNDEAMAEAAAEARATFRFFWREMAWEARRIVPACQVAAVKVAFSDDGDLEGPGVEHMWVSEVDFDGHTVRGVLLNSPRALRSVRAGDPVQVPLARIEDWMYAIDDRAYGGYTINLMRQGMGQRERVQHDNAWGLDFGDPATIELVPSGAGWFDHPDDEHPMSVNMAPQLAEHIAANPSFVTDTDERGWTALHDQALAGSLETVKVLVEAGADVHAKTRDGDSPRALAEKLGWVAVADYLRDRAAN